jgi:hypothetical protein
MLWSPAVATDACNSALPSLAEIVSVLDNTPKFASDLPYRNEQFASDPLHQA